jgi:hypothetical protein
MHRIMRAFLPSVALIALASAALAAGQRFSPRSPSFATLFSAFNENYKQALYATQQGERDRSAGELAATRLTWEMVLLRYYETPPEAYRKDARWKADLATVSGYVDAAEAQLHAGNLAEAHASLEPIRRLWADINERNGVRRFGDALTRFHDVMELAVLAGKTADEATLAAFQGKLEALTAGWRKVQHFGFLPKRAEDKKRFKELVAAETLAVQNLTQAAEAKDCAGIQRLAPEVKNAFAELYLAFG